MAALGCSQASLWQFVALQRTPQVLQFAIALGDLRGIGVDQGQGLLEGKQVLIAPVAL